MPKPQLTMRDRWRLDQIGDSLFDSTTPTAPTHGVAAAAGTSATASRVDHNHGLTTTFTVATKTAAYTITSGDQVILADATTAAFTITLPAATGKQRLIVVKIDSSANAVTISRAGTDTIEGAASLSLATQYKKAQLVADGTGTWYNLGTGAV